jgi:hypothetical protein
MEAARCQAAHPGFQEHESKREMTTMASALLEYFLLFPTPLKTWNFFQHAPMH